MSSHMAVPGGRINSVRLRSDAQTALETRPGGAKRRGAEWAIRCFFPERHTNGDARPSACYNAEKGVWHCNACGASGGLVGGDEPLAALLGIDPEQYREPSQEKARQNRAAKRQGTPSRTTRYPYRDAAGRVIYQAVRLDYADGSKTFRLERPGQGRALAGLGEGADRVALVLYRLPELQAADPAELVLIVEGEKCADALAGLGFTATTNPMGAGKWRDEFSEALAGRHVVILPDNDDPGTGHARDVARSVQTARAASVKLLDLAEHGSIPPKGDVVDWIALGHDATELRRMIDAIPELPPEPLPLRTIEVHNRQLRDIGRDALEALLEANAAGLVPVIFVRGVGLAHVQLDDDGRPVIREHDGDSIRSLLARWATWTTTTRRKDGPHVEAVDPPLPVVGFVRGRREWRFPALRAVATAPVLTPDWRILAQPGYDPASGIVYAGVPFDVPEGAPSASDVDHAKRLLLDDLLGDFPFVDDSGRAHAIAYALLPFVRHAIAGPTPFFLADAPTARTGKTLLCVVAAMPFVAGAVPVSPPKREEELGKWILGKLVQGATHAIIDNLPSKLDSAAFASTITGTDHDGRILGQTLVVTVPNRAVWAVTGNNITMTEELAGRAYWCRLDSGVEFPGDRDQKRFRHADIKRWVTEHRAELVAAILTLIRAWLHAGRPDSTGRLLAGFEAWSRTLGGILEVAGIDGFLANSRELWETADPDAQNWRAFVVAWFEAHGENPTTAAELVPLAIANGVVDPDAKRPPQSLGYGLRAHRDRVVSGCRIRSGEKGKHGVSWRLEMPSSDDRHPSSLETTEVAIPRGDDGDDEPNSASNGRTVQQPTREHVQGGEYETSSPSSPQGVNNRGSEGDDDVTMPATRETTL